MPLTDSVISNAIPGITPAGKATSKPYKMGDAGGLYLEVAPSGGKWWRLKYRYAGKEKRIALGVYPNVSLDEARSKRTTMRALLADGIDPAEHTKAEKVAQRAEEARQIAATRFNLDNDGALSFRFGNRRVSLNPAETAELRIFLDATRAVTPKVTLCP